MTNPKLSTEPYKGTRDFYPEDMAVQRYIFDTWAKTAEQFGYERYDASILEPAELYKSKGAENEEMVNEQTYTFTDRGDREVTLRPEMTPTVARMIAHKERELHFPVRWYAIPNLFRYERPQRGRLREHWQLNCDLFGSNDIAADIEVIQLAYNVLTSFGATPDMFQIRLNDRALMQSWYRTRLNLDDEVIRAVTRLIDRKNKMPINEFTVALSTLVPDVHMVLELLDTETSENLGIDTSLTHILAGLKALGITNVRFDATLARGFDYYTGTIFEFFDTDPNNNRSLIGGGRYDNLTAMFGGESIPGIGFGMGDVTMRDFLESHNLLPDTVRTTAPTVMIIPTDEAQNERALVVAHAFRTRNVNTGVDFGDRKLGKKISTASERGVSYVLVVGENEIASNQYTLKKLTTQSEAVGTPEELAALI